MAGNMVGDRLKELRVQAGVTQKAFADALNVSSSAVSKWENGQNEPDMEMLLKIVAYYGISIEELLTDKPKEADPVNNRADSKNADSDSKEEDSGSKEENQGSKKMKPDKRKGPLHKENRVKWLGAGIALGCVFMAVVLLTGIAVWKMGHGKGDAFSFEILAGRYAEDVNWGEVYEVSAFYTGELTDENMDEIRNEIMAQWKESELCSAEIEIIKIIYNNDRELAEAFSLIPETVTYYLFPYAMTH